MTPYPGAIKGTPQPVKPLREEDYDRLRELCQHPQKHVAEQAERILRYLREAGL